MLNIIQMLNESVSKAPYLVSKDKKLMDRYYLSPSSATCYTNSGQPVGACIKQIWLDKKDYPISNLVTAYNQFTFDAGKMWEDWLIQQYKKLNIYKEIYELKNKPEEEIVFKYYQFIDVMTEEEFYSNMNEMANMSLYDTGVTAMFGDQLLTLSTCDYNEKNGRFVVVAKRVNE